LSGLPDIYGEQSAQLPNYARYPVEFVRGEGAHLYDTDGREYLDLLCGIGVNSVGHCHPLVVEAIEAQASTLLHASNLFWTEPAERLARILVDQSFGDKVFFCNSGAEANEAALKLARAHAFNSGSPARDVVVFERAFHGRTFGALSATPQEDKQAPFAPLVHGFRTVARDDPQAVIDAVNDQTCAVIVEPVQGEGGIYEIPHEVLQAARSACDSVGALLIFDEVQCGLLRTGTMWAHEQTPVQPDVMTLAKALGGGLPIGAMVAAANCSDALKPGFHGSTFGGNPVACAAANAVLEILADNSLIANVNEVGTHFRKGLSEYGTPAGRGLMIGLALDEATDAKKVVEQLLHEERIVANATGPSTLRFLPPLALTRAQADEAVAALGRTLINV
jgi:predicted acetylornithine/succinylornithine family transaminase